MFLYTIHVAELVYLYFESGSRIYHVAELTFWHFKVTRLCHFKKEFSIPRGTILVFLKIIITILHCKANTSIRFDV